MEAVIFMMIVLVIFTVITYYYFFYYQYVNTSLAKLKLYLLLEAKHPHHRLSLRVGYKFHLKQPRQLQWNFL